MTKYNRIYKRLEQVFGFDLKELEKITYLKLEAAPYMALSVDVLQKENNLIKISMAHNFEMNGDIVPDPDMEVEINLEYKTAEALSFQNQYIYSAVYEYNDKGEKTGVRPLLRKELNEFLEMWTKNLIEQGHKVTIKKEA